MRYALTAAAAKMTSHCADAAACAGADLCLANRQLGRASAAGSGSSRRPHLCGPPGWAPCLQHGMQLLLEKLRALLLFMAD